MHKLVLLRHGESTWNLENRFTGWTDVDLSPKGVEEATAGAKLLKEGGYVFDLAHTSLLRRAIRTLWITLEGMDLMWIPVKKTWRLNERHYGALQGLNKAETAKKFGDEQVKIWRRAYATPPPPLTPDDERHAGRDPRYAGLTKDLVPLTESLKDTVARFLPYWHDAIVPDLKAGKRVLIAAHGNSLRALVKHLDGISDDEIVSLNIPTGIPLVYELTDELTPIRHYYLGDPEAAKKAAEAVANQSKAKPEGLSPRGAAFGSGDEGSAGTADSSGPAGPASLGMTSPGTVTSATSAGAGRWSWAAASPPWPSSRAAAARTSTRGCGRASRRWRASARWPASARRCGSSATRSGCPWCAAAVASTWRAPPASCTRRSASSRWTSSGAAPPASSRRSSGAPRSRWTAKRAFSASGSSPGGR